MYSKLKTGGGFEVLSLITPSQGGYSVAFLRVAAGLGQALAYIRPLQKDLNMLKNLSTEQVSEYKTSLIKTPWISWLVSKGERGFPQLESKVAWSYRL